MGDQADTQKIESQQSSLLLKTLTVVSSKKRCLIDVLLDINRFSVQHSRRGDLTVCRVDGEPVSRIGQLKISAECQYSTIINSNAKQITTACICDNMKSRL